MKKCECYHEVIREIYNHYLNRTLTAKEGECWGTKERDICSCKGDKCKCDIYPHVKEKALKEKQQKEHKSQHTKSVAYVKDSLNFYLDSHEEKGVEVIKKIKEIAHSFMPNDTARDGFDLHFDELLKEMAGD